MKNSLLKITLIEEDEDDQLIFSTILESIPIPARLTYLECRKGVDSNIGYLESSSPDIIFLGCPLESKTVVEYLKRIRGNHLLKEKLCVVLSGYSHASYLEEIFNAGADFHINKSTDLSVMKNMITKVLKADLDNYLSPKFESFLLSDN